MNVRLLIAILTAIQFTFLVDFVMMMPLGPRLMRDLHCSPGAFANLVAAYTIASGIAAALAGLILDRLDRRTAILLFFGGLILATAVCGFMETYHSLLLARVAAGACGGLVGALVFAIIGERIPWEQRGKASGMVMSAFSLASIIGIPIGMGLANIGAWQTPFIALAGFGAVVWVVAWIGLTPMAEHREHTKRSMLKTVTMVFSDPGHQRAFLLTICLTFSGFAVIPLLATSLVTNAGISEAHVAWFYGIGGIVTVFTGPYIGRLADRFGKRRIFIAVAASSMVPLVVCTHLNNVGEWVAIGCGVVFVTLVSGRFVPAMAMITQSAKPEVRGAFQAYHTAVQSLTSGLATQFAGWLVISDAQGRLVGYGTVGWCAAAATVLAIAASLRLRMPSAAAAPPVIPA